MASESYYFLFSIIAIFIVGLYLINAVYYRLKKKTLFGESFKPGTTDYRLMQKYTSNRRLIISGTIGLVCIINPIFVYGLLQLPNLDGVYILLIYTPILITALGVVLIAKMRP